MSTTSATQVAADNRARLQVLKERIYKLHADGLSHSIIATRIGMSKKFVKRTLKARHT